MTDVNQLITDHLDIWTAATEKKSSAGRGNGGGLILYGVQKLRELVLQLAVRGKLVPQVDSDGHAEVLLKEIEHERTRLLGQHHITKPRAVNANQMVAGTISVPSNWLQLPLTDVYLSISPSKNKLKKTEFEEAGEFPIVDQGQEFISGYCDRDDLVIAIPHPVVVFGDHTRNIKYVDFDFVAGADGTKIMCPLAMFPKYFAMFLTSLDIEAKGYSRHFKVLNSHVFNLPPVVEQHRIVAKVDELMTLCDALERQAEDSLKAHQTLVETCLATLTNSRSPEDLTQNWTRIEAHFDTLFTTEESLISLWNSVLKLAIRGDLVPQKSSEEPASGCLLGINAAKNIMISEGRLRKTKVLKSIEEDELPFARPEGWAWSRLNDFIDVRDGTHDSPKDARTGDTFPLITSKNFKNGDIDFDSARRISAEDHHEISKRSRVERDDILFSMIGGNLGNQVIVKTDQEFSVKNVALFKYYDRTKSIPDFVKLYMENLAIDLQSQASGGAQPFVSLGFLRNLLIGVPPVDEQKRIVTKAREVERLIEATRDRISSSKTKEIELADTLTSKIH